MSEFEEMQENIIELTDEDGNNVEFEILMTFDYGDNFYAAMVPACDCGCEECEEEEEEEVLLMRVEEDGEEDVFYPIEDDEELENVWQEFLKIYYEEESDEE